MAGEFYKLSFDSLKWFIDRDPEDEGKKLGWTERISENAAACRIPSIIQQYLPGHHGVAFYWCPFQMKADIGENECLFLHFDGVDYKAEVWLDGKLLGSHEGGEAPFAFDVTGLEKGEHLLAVRVVNPIDRDIDGLNLRNIPCRNKTLKPAAGSGLNCGGIWYNVSLIALPRVYLNCVQLKGDIHTGELTVNAEVRSAAAEDEEMRVEIRVFERSGKGELKKDLSDRLTAKPGLVSAAYTLKIEDVRLWSPEDPHLYRVEVRLITRLGEHSVIRSFGFRDFRVKDGYFYLNDKRIYLRSSHTGNNFPGGQMLPCVPEQLRSDLIFAKDSGFNMIRSIAGVLRPEQLDICDEIGLMVYEECYASWCLGYGCDSPVGDEARMLQRYKDCTFDMIRRDINHPSVVVWGMLNESPKDKVFDLAVSLLPEVMRFDDTRLIFLNAGRFDNCLSVGSYANPGSRSWQYGMGIDSPTAQTVRDGNSPYESGDYHCYPDTPMTETYMNSIRALGHSENAGPVFYSETGIGSLFNVIEEWREFEAHGLSDELEDAAWLKKQSLDFMADFDRFGLDRVFPFPETLLKESQRVHSAERTELFNVIRSNPRISGYSLTGFLDHGMCGEGLISYWRRNKPLVYDALRDGWAPLKFCLLTKRHVFAGEDFEFTAVLANDGILAPGKYTASFAFVSEEKVERTFSREFTVTYDRPFATQITHEFLPGLPAGDITIQCRLDAGAAPEGCTRVVHVTDRESLGDLGGKAITFVGMPENAKAFLISRGAVSAENTGRILAGPDLTVDQIRALAEEAQNGAHVAFLGCGAFAQEGACEALGVSRDLKYLNFWDWLYHKECVVTRHPLMDGFKPGLAVFDVFGQTFPHPCFSTSELPDEVISPAFYTGYHAIEGGYGAYHALCRYRRGEGSILLSCYRVLENLGIEPAAERLLMNFAGEI